jgi:hypothetical protein
MVGATVLFASSGVGAFGLVIVIGVVVSMYFIPSIVAAIRRVPNTGSVAVINLFLGWTLIGWVVALAMASRSQPASALNQAHVAIVNTQPKSGAARHCVYCGGALSIVGKFCPQCGQSTTSS